MSKSARLAALAIRGPKRTFWRSANIGEQRSVSRRTLRRIPSQVRRPLFCPHPSRRCRTPLKGCDKCDGATEGSLAPAHAQEGVTAALSGLTTLSLMLATRVRHVLR
jgi:hypothetical protein